MNYKKSLLLLTLSILFILPLQAQFSLRLTESHKDLKAAIANFELGHYQQTQTDVQKYLSGLKQQNTHSIYTATATFYDLMASLAQNKAGSKIALAAFLKETPFASLQQYGYFRMAKFLFQSQDYENAIPFYERADINYLSNNEISARNFELAYCYLINNQIDKVKPLFNSIKDVQGEYYGPGNYYNGVVSYYNGDYDAALKSFDAVKNEAVYKDAVQFYMAELNYFKGNKDKALELAINYLGNKDLGYVPQMAQLASQIYYEKEDYASASKVLKEYASATNASREDDYFRSGYTYYQIGDLAHALVEFEKIKSGNTLLGAQGLYYSGLCYLKLGDKENALAAFSASLLNPKIGSLKEDVQFNVAKLNYDLDKKEDAETRLDEFISQYPTSLYYKDAVEMLALLSLKDQNFEKAIAAFNKLGNLTPVFQAIYQKMNYARGIQLLKDGNSQLAVPLFTESLKYPVNDDLNGLAEFWKAECLYRLGDYYNALSASNKFINQPGPGNSPALIRSAYLINAYAYKHLNDSTSLKLAYVAYLDTTGDLSTPQILSNMDTLKPNYVPSHVPFVEANPYIFVYELPSQDIKFLYRPMPLKPMSFEKRVTLPNNKNYIKAGYGSIKTSILEVGYDLSEDVHQDLYLNISQRSSNAQRVLQDASATCVALTHKRDIKNYRLTAQIGLDRNVVRTYGMNNPESISNASARIRYVNPTLQVEVAPIIPNKLAIDYSVLLNAGVYNRSVYQNGLLGSNEINFRLQIPASRQLNESTKLNVGLDMDANANHYQSMTSTTSFFSIKPSIEKTYNQARIMLGLYPTFGQKTHLLPQLKITNPITNIHSQLEVGIESELLANSYKSQSQLNPWLAIPSGLIQTKRSLYYASLFGSPRNNFNYEVKFGLGNVKNLPLYFNDQANNKQFGVTYEPNAMIMSLQAHVEYHLNYNTNAGASLNYEPIVSTKTFNHIWHYIPMQLDVYAKYVYRNALMLRADLLTRSGIAVLENGNDNKKVNGAFDFNLQANYFLNERWSVFLEGNNLLNNKYQRWYLYPTYGANMAFGLVYSFNKSISSNFKNLQIK